MTTMAERAMGLSPKAAPLSDLAAHSLTEQIAAANLRHEIKHRRRPQQAICACNVAGGSGPLLKAGTVAGTSYPLAFTLPVGFAFEGIVASKADFETGNWGLQDVAMGDYNMATSPATSAPNVGPLDIFDVQTFIEQAVAPWVGEDGKLKAALSGTVTVYCYTPADFHGIWFKGTTSGKRCALKDNLEPDRRGPYSVLRELKSLSVPARNLIQTLLRHVPSRIQAIYQKVVAE
jgi:hypothetical protein